jgi:hypothetical protein
MMRWIEKVNEAVPDSAVDNKNSKKCTFVHEGLENITFGKSENSNKHVADLGQKYEVTKR